ncbi:MAG: 6,7-dimethyl-8-ribityllumazine synthase, partial [Candidatus Krumholzibacteriaceae bacterium]
MVREKAGHLTGAGASFAVVIGRFNELVSSRLLSGAVDCLVRHDVAEKDIHVYWVPGSFEIPQVAKRAAATGVDAVICLGALIRGETAHFDILANQVVRDASSVALESGKPVAFGVIAADTQEQALERAGSKAGNKGWQAALSALEMANLW